jgi:hypothetical protein
VFLYDPEIEKWAVSVVFPEEEHQDRKASKPGNVRDETGRGSSREGSAIFQASLKRGFLRSLFVFGAWIKLIAAVSFWERLSFSGTPLPPGV